MANENTYKLDYAGEDIDNLLQKFTSGEIAIQIKGKGKPTHNTAGKTGWYYLDTVSGALYICTDATYGVYTWASFSVEALSAQVLEAIEAVAKATSEITETADEITEAADIAISAAVEAKATVDGKANAVYAESETATELTFEATEAAPFRELHIYGTTTQESEPTPDNPKPIVSSCDFDVIVSDGNGNEQIVHVDVPLHVITNSSGVVIAQDKISVVSGKVELTQNCYELVLTGDETNIYFYSYATGYTGLRIAQSGIYAAFSQSYGGGLCSHFTNRYNMTAKYADTVVFGYTSSYYTAVFLMSDLSQFGYTQDIAGWRAWLKDQYDAGTPVTVLYRLAKPIISDITDTALGQSLLGLRSYDGTTTITANAAPVVDLRTNVKLNYDLLKMNRKTYDPSGMNMDVFGYIDRANTPRYGVSGVGGASTTLTRLWDSFGKVAMVSTDEDDPTYRNDFDDLSPFNRRKCVGTWSRPINGKSKFTVKSYYGDPDYTEDGSMGDYVAVEVEPFWYYQHLEADGTYTLGVSAGRRSSWSIHPVCIDSDGNMREKTYLPCYSLVLKDGKAVSLPGYHPEFGSYSALWTKARTYNSVTHLEPMAVRHYEWLLFTIEFATTNCQNVMYGAGSMRYTSDKVSLAETDTNSIVVTAAVGTQYLVGQSIYIGSSYSKTPDNVDAYNVITDIEKCTVDGTLDENGTYRKITFSGASRTVTTATQIGSRPWITGACNSVKKPSGVPCTPSDTGLTPVSAEKYPMRYRWRENIWGNLNSTCIDIFVKREGAGTADDPYCQAWYYPADTSYYFGEVKTPAATTLTKDGFVKLPMTSVYSDGYIRKILLDSRYPHVIIPGIGATNATYYCDYVAFLVVSTSSAFSIKFGGWLSNGTGNGILCVSTVQLNRAETMHWNGAGLYFNQ